MTDTTDWRARVHDAFAQTIALHQEFAALDPSPMLRAAEAVVGAFARNGTLLIFGNGGSAADAQHVAAELVGRFQVERRALAAIALTTDTSVLTSLANDDAFNCVFARQVEALGRPNDVVLAISTSGQSGNVVEGLKQARQQGLATIALTGCDGGAIGSSADIHINVPSPVTARVQEVHRTILHVLCDLVESSAAGLRVSS